MDRTKIQTRSMESDFVTGEDDSDLYIEGYFAVFNSNYELWKGATESIAPEHLPALWVRTSGR